MFRGNSHHAQMIAYCEEVDDLATHANCSRFGPRVTSILRSVRRTFKNPPITAMRRLSHLHGPAIVLEYLENGTLMQLSDRLFKDKINLPNRLLWRWYFCCKTNSALLFPLYEMNLAD
jgi:hypothetical protein